MVSFLSDKDESPHLNLPPRGEEAGGMTETTAAGHLEIARRAWVGRDRLRRDLAEIAASGDYDRSAYFTSATGAPATDAVAAAAMEALPDLGTGAAVFWGSRSAVAIAPPFPIDEELQCGGVDVGPMLDLLSRDVTVGVVLLRLGRYAVGVVENGRLAASKSDTRYVKNRHRKGGSSQRRFARSRERLVRELYDKVCAVTEDVFRPYGDRIEYLLLGGERQTLLAFTKRCGYVERSGIEVLPRRLEVDRPGKATLDTIHRQVWMSRVVYLGAQSEGEAG